MKLLHPPAEAADEKRQAEHEQQVADDAAGDRRLDQFDVSVAQCDDRDDQLRGVAERGVEKTAPRRAGTARQLLRAEANQAGERDQRRRRGHEEPRRLRRDHRQDPGYGGEQQQDVDRRRRDLAQHQSPNLSRSSSSAPGNKSKNASRLRSSERRSCGMVPSKVWRVSPADDPSASFNVASSTPLSVPSGMSR